VTNPGRNAPCPCGSGKKYKQCCARQAHSLPPGLRLLVVVLAVALAIAVLITVLDRGHTTDAPGRVWSAEHGHYHEREIVNGEAAE